MEMNRRLGKAFTKDEVRKAMMQMYPFKALMSDGMPPLVYQHFWPNISEVVTKTILDFLNNGLSPPNFNEMHIVLIPKIKEPKRVSDYRPISLCNVVFKREWVCLEKIMEKLGFEDKCRKLIMQCVTSVYYSIRINEKPKGHIVPTRGIKQGDPLSPFLFLLFEEGLFALI